MLLTTSEVVMNITTTFDRPEPVLVRPIDVPPGQVYSWGSKQVSYLRVFGGSSSQLPHPTLVSAGQG